MMDLGSIPELANHFAAVSQAIMPVIHHAIDPIINAGANIWAGITDPAAMSTGERNFQLLKIAVSTFGFGASVGTANIEGAAACAVTDCEAVIELAKAGAKVRHLHAGGP